MTFNRLSVLHDYSSDRDYAAAAGSRERQREFIDGTDTEEDEAVQARLREDTRARHPEWFAPSPAVLAQVAEDIDVISRAAFTPKDAA